MPNFSNDDLLEIKARVDLADVIEEHGIHIRRVGSSAKACCPFHKEKTPSFNINADKGFYKCFGCGESGDVFTFLQKMDGISFAEAVQRLAERAGVTLHEHYDPQAKTRQKLYAIHSELAAFYRRCLLQTREAAHARAYLEERALNAETQELFGIGYAPRQKDAVLNWAKHHGYTPDELVAAGVLAPPRAGSTRYYDRFAGRITFPICDAQGRVIAFSSRLLEKNAKAAKYVNSPETDIFKKSLTLYAFHLARAAIAKQTPRRAIICEGQIDVIRCHACGFHTAIASQGTAFTDEHVRILKRVADTATLVFDGDAAGIKAAMRTAGLFFAAGIPIRIASLPPGEDPDTLLRAQGAEAFRAILDAAEDPAPYIVRALRANEADPDSMEAVTRHARIVVELIKSCEEPVLTAKFLQDAADALKLPLAALEHNLNLARESNVMPGSASRAESNTAPNPPAASAMDDAEVIDYGDEEYMIEDSFGGDDAALETESAPTVSLADLEASRSLTEAFCELLIHHFADPGIMECFLRHLPAAFIDTPLADALFALACSAHLKGLPTLDISRADPRYTENLARLVARPDKLLGEEEAIILAAARDIVKRYWLREYQRRLQALDPNTDEALTLALSSKRLEALRWEQAAPYMDALAAKPQAHPQLRPKEDAPKAAPAATHTPPPEPDKVPTPPLSEADLSSDFYATL